MTNYFHIIKPERFFLYTAGLFGTLFLLFTPPFQVPDETNHFFRAWQVSEGGFTSVKENNRVGGYLPVSLEEISSAFFPLIWYGPTYKTNRAHIVNMLEAKLDPAVKKFFDFNNTALYSPVCYFPQAVAIFILRITETPPLYIFYTARFFALLFWIFSVYHAVRITPVYKWFFSFLALLPMSLFINISVSADVMTNAISFLFIALILKCAYSDVRITSKIFACLASLVFLLASLKTVYAPAVLILLIIPKAKFGDTKRYILSLCFLFSLGLITLYAWNSLLNPLYISYSQYNEQFRSLAAVAPGASMPDQVKFILNNGTYLCHVMVDSLAASFDMYSKGYIGTLGCLDIELPLWFICGCYILIILLAVIDNNSNTRMPASHKLLFMGAFLLVLFLVLLSQLLIWVPVGSDLILNIQGRYLIPCLPLLFMVFYSCRSFKIAVAPIVILSCLLSLSYSTYLIYARYYQ